MSLLTLKEISNPEGLNLENRPTQELLDIKQQLKGIESDILNHELPDPLNLGKVKWVHARVSDILAARGFSHLEQLLPIRSSGRSEKWPKVTEGDVVEHFGVDAILIRNYVELGGSICNLGATEGDIDISIASAMRDKATEFRIIRALPKQWAERLHFHYRDEEGHAAPITSHMPLFDLRLTPCLNKAREELSAKENIRKSKIDDYKDSIKQNRIGIGRFFLPLKTSLSPIPAYRATDTYNTDQIEDWVSALQRKNGLGERPVIGLKPSFNGARIIIHKIGKNTIFFTDGGKDVTNHFSSIRKQVLKVKADNLILDTEAYCKIGKEYKGRSWINSWVKSHLRDDNNVILTVSDCLYYESDKESKGGLNLKAGDIHKLPLSTRLEYLETLNFPKSKSKSEGLLKLVPTLVAETEEELRNYDKVCCTTEGSKGAILKWMGGDYPLTGMTRTWCNQKNHAQLHVIILKKSPTTVNKKWAYQTGLICKPDSLIHPDHLIEFNKETYVECGSTSKTNATFKPGDIVIAMFHTLTMFESPDGIYTHLYDPILIENPEDQPLPDSIEAAVDIAKKAGCYNYEKEDSVGKRR